MCCQLRASQLGQPIPAFPTRQTVGVVLRPEILPGNGESGVAPREGVKGGMKRCESGDLPH